MNTIKFTMAARCEAAGRPNNEDNFQLADHLTGNQWSFVADQEVDLDEKGALLVVCDGMGGANAGEVASKMAVDTIKEWFSPERLTNEATALPKVSQSISKKPLLPPTNKSSRKDATTRKRKEWAVQSRWHGSSANLFTLAGVATAAPTATIRLMA